MYQIGYVGNSTPSAESALVAGLRQDLRERRYTEGKDIVIHYRWAAGKNDLVSEIIAEFVELKLDVIVTSGTLAPFVAKKATTVIPVVMAASGDPVGSGIVASLSRPGGNITGLSTVYADLEGKRLEILRELVPKLTRLALLANPASTVHANYPEGDARGGRADAYVHRGARGMLAGLLACYLTAAIVGILLE